MIIAIPLDDSKETVCASFGRVPYFLFHNTDTNTSKPLQNDAANAQGGAGIKAAQFVIDHKADALITVRCGENAAEVLLSEEINIHKAEKISIAENLKAMNEGKLAQLQNFHAGFHGKV